MRGLTLALGVGGWSYRRALHERAVLWLCRSLIALVLFVPGFRGVAAAQALPAPAAPMYNPMRAVHDVEVGKFYMKRGDTDGAIARFKDAMQYKPNYAEPCLQLGQAYEKKNDPASALDYYQRYLKILPGAPESKKVRERIAKLEEKLKKDRSAAPQQAPKNPLSRVIPRSNRDEPACRRQGICFFLGFSQKDPSLRSG